jgi:hypothetical protein
MITKITAHLMEEPKKPSQAFSRAKVQSSSQLIDAHYKRVSKLNEK